MFGYVIANPEALDSPAKARYRAVYCGLCRELGRRSGLKARLTLNYDAAFLVIILESVYGLTPESGVSSCFIHPMKKHEYHISPATAYAADMNVLLSHDKLLDNWSDDKSLASWAGAAILEREKRRIELAYPRQSAQMAQSLAALGQMERLGETKPDLGAAQFGALMGELFVWKQDEQEAALRAFGDALGRFIYILDACLDLQQDIKKERYNPLVMTDRADFEPILNMLMGECAEAFEALPIHKDEAILRNIIYSGVWTRYAAQKKKGKKPDDRPL